MLKSLHIKNYRNLKDFRLDSVDRVNLITGKNNTGKSTLLEAIVIYATKGNPANLEQILEQHGELMRQSVRQYGRKFTEEEYYKALSSLFTNRIAGFEPEDYISIGEIEDNLFKELPVSTGSVVLRFVKYFNELRKSEEGNLFRQRIIFEDEKLKEDLKLGFQISINNVYERLYPLDNFNFRQLGYGERVNTNNHQFIKTANIDRKINSQLFDEITLTDKERFVIDALRIIEPQTERIAFVENDSRISERVAVIKLKNSKDIYPLKSMGDGINRILTIILALINSEDGFLMIDEFENGLHYTVQEQLWRIIFKLSVDLNVQVFATTHSEDCISGFERVLNSSEVSASGKLIRMDNIDGIIKKTMFSPDELKIANEQDIELR